MVELVVIEVDARVDVALLDIDVFEMLFEGYFGSFLCVEIDPDEAVAVDLGVYAEKPVLAFVEF